MTEGPTGHQPLDTAYTVNVDMKAFLVIGLVAASAHARSDDGFSSVSRTEDSLGNYQFGYDITDWDTNRKRWEQADAHNNRKGGYSITDVDGKVRHLEYVADKAGFRAVIRTNEPGTAPGYSGDALYVRDGVKQIITSAQPALQFTGHVIKQKKLAIAAPVIAQPKVIYQQPIVQQPIVRQVVQPKPIVYHQPVIQPAVHIAKPVVYQQPLVKPALQVYQNIQPVVHVAPKPVHVVQHQPIVHQPIVHQPIVHQPIVHQPIVHQPIVHQPIVHQPIVHQLHKPVVYQQPLPQIVQPIPIAKPVVYQQPLVQPVTKVHFQTYQHVQPVVVEQPKLIAPAPIVVAKPIVASPVIEKFAVPQTVLLKEKKIIVTPPPAYSGPRRRPQKLIEDPSQSYETPELPKLTPKRVPGYNPGLEDFEDDYDSLTVAPPLSRGRVAYSPDERDLAVSKFSPLYIKAGGITRKSGSFPPLAGPPSRRARA